MLLLFALLIQCSRGDLSRSEAKDKILKKFGGLNYKFYPGIFKNNTEFASIQDIQFGTGKVVVTGLRKNSDTEILAEFHIDNQYDLSALQKIVDAIEKLENRLITLKPIQYTSNSYWGMSTQRMKVWKFTDPSNNQVFTETVPLTPTSPDIRKSNEWRTLSEMKNSFLSMLGGKKNIGLGNKTQILRFVRYDDGWRAENFVGGQF